MQGHDIEAERIEILKRYRNLLSVCKPNTTKQDKQLIRKAFNLALEAHKDMRRRTGEPYIYHPIAVASLSAGEIGLGTTSVVCALLHDVVEDTDYTLTDIEGLFGEKVARIIDGLTKISGIFDNSSSSLQAENFRKMLLTLSEDVRVILIKLADRLHNMRTLDSMPRDKQLKIAYETAYLYAPLSHRLGLYAIKSELEDLAFKYTEPEIFNSIYQKLKDTEKERSRFINKFIYPLRKTLSEQGLKYKITGRAKSIHSIWEKMKKKEIPFEEVFDLFAIRIIIDSNSESEKADCWKVYSIITDFYRPNPDRLRDWISTPKANGYESLHTTVMSSMGKWVEVQIRSTRMDEIAEKGYAAHWKYKEVAAVESGLDDWLKKIRELLKSPDSNALDFLEDFKLNLFSDEIFVFTPKGDLKTLPIKSTALDFAYNIHSKVGENCIGAKVNLKLVPISYQLKSGDQIEIITSVKQKPKEEWLNTVITAKAKSRIKDYLKDEKRKLAEGGKVQLEEKLALINFELTNSTLNKLMLYFNLKTPTDLYYNVAIEKITSKELKAFSQVSEKSNWLNFLKPSFIFPKEKEESHKTLTEDLLEKYKQKKNTIVIGDSEEQQSYVLSPCCNPIPGDDVFGFITLNEGIKIHRTNCPNAINLMSSYASRVVKAKWTSKESETFLSGIKMIGIDKVGIISSVTKIITKENHLNIRSIRFDSFDGTFEGSIMLFVNNTESLNDLISKLKGVGGIEKVYRIDKED